jgi:hypothetical protein
MTMFSLTIAFGETPAMWRLLFKTEEAAKKGQSLLGTAEACCSIADDFGQTCTLEAGAVCGWMLEDLDQSKQAGVEMMLHNARTQAQAQAQARTEPALRQVGQSPSVFVPGMNGRN